MPHPEGTRLGVYEIVASLGDSGAGEVYRARDSLLGREVALRVLPDTLSKDSARMAAFARDAQNLATLNHPGIPALHHLGDAGGVPVLVTEFVEGPTLADRLAHGPVPMEEALRIALQAADALEAAHDRGITHGDLRPAEIKLSPEGTVKILDLGLERAVEEASALQEPADRRSDVWAFGGLLYEMLAGRQDFGKPDWKSLPQSTPPAILRLLMRTLEPDRRRRLRDIAEARIAIEDVLQGRADAMPAPAPAPPQTLPKRRPASLWMFVSAALAVVAGVLWLMRPVRPTPEPSAPVSFSIPVTPEDAALPSQGPPLAFSDDGKELVFASGGQLYLRTMDRADAVAIPGTDGAAGPFLSPDGKSVGFVAGGKLQRVPVYGGAATILCDAPEARGASWAPDDTIVFAPAMDSGLMRVPAAGGAPQALTKLDSGAGEQSHRWPQVLPGGKAVLFTIGSAQSVNDYDNAAIAVQALDSGRRQTLAHGGRMGRYSARYLFYLRGSALFAAPFDLARLSLGAQPIALHENIGGDYLSGAGAFTLSESGSLAYFRAGVPRIDVELNWLKR